MFEGWDGHTCSLIASVDKTEAVDKQECGVAPTEDGSTKRQWKVVAAANDSGSNARATVREGQWHCC